MKTSPSLPRSTTWEVLQKSRNLAAVAVLAHGLRSERSELRKRCIEALLARNDEPSLRSIILHWENFDSEDISVVRYGAKRFSEVAKSILDTGSLSEKKSALAAIAALDLTQALDSVLKVVVKPRHSLCVLATECLLEICERWGEAARSGKDIPSIRTPMIEALNYQLVLFHEHKNLAVVDAWLNLVHWDDSAQRGMISDPRQDAYRSVLNCLAHSDRLPVLQLLGGYLWRSTTPKAVVSLLVERPEPALAIEIANLLDEQTLPSALKRLRRLPPLKSLANIDIESLDLGFEAQKKLWVMLAASSDDLLRVLRGAMKLSQVGTSEARQTAAEMIRRCRRPELDKLVPAIHASTMQAKETPSLSDLLVQLASWLESPSTVLKKAGAEFLADFTLENLLERVHQWPTQMCKSMANIVLLKEKNVEETLSRELQSPSPKRRMAALQATDMLGCARKVSDWLMPLLEDPRMDVRVRVIDLLSALGHESLETLIPQLLQDASTDIQDAANRAVRRLNRRINEPAASQSPTIEHPR